MSWIIRTSTALVLTLATIALPCVLNLCAATCVAHHGGAPATAPGCHHTGSSTSRLGHLPTPCGHDHEGTVTAIGAAADLVRPAASVLAVIVLPPYAGLIALHRIGTSPGPPGSALVVDARSLPLRI